MKSLPLLLLVSAILIVCTDAEAPIVFDDDLVGMLENYEEMPPFLLAVSLPQGPLVYPNNRQLRKLPGHSIFHARRPNYTAEASAYLGYFGHFLSSSYGRTPSAKPPNGTRVEDQYYSFKAMIVTDDNWKSISDSLLEKQAEREADLKEEEERRLRTTTAPPTTTTSRRTVPPSIVRPRPERRQRTRRAIHIPRQSYEEIPRLKRMEYPIREIVQELGRCEQGETVEMNANIFTHRGNTKMKLLEGGGTYMGVAIYRITCRPMSASHTFVAIGLQRIIYETTGQASDILSSEAILEEMIQYGHALLNEHIYNNYYYPYLHHLATYSTMVPHIPPEKPSTTTNARTTTSTTAATTTSVTAADYIYLDDVDIKEEEEDEEDDSLPSSALVDNRVPKVAGKRLLKFKRGENLEVERSMNANRNANRSNRQNVTVSTDNGQDESSETKKKSRRSRDLRETASEQQTEWGWGLSLDEWKAKLAEAKKQAIKGSCRLEAHDVCIVMDESGSIGSGDFEMAKKFVADLTKVLRVGPGEYESRVSLIKFSDSASVAFKLNQHLSNDAVYSAIMGLPYVGGGTNIAAGMNVAVQEIFTRPEGRRLFTSADGDRSWIPNMMIVMTDGQDNSNVEGARASALLKNISVNAIGIGLGINPAQLTRVTGASDRVYKVSDFASLNGDFIKKLCAPLDNNEGLEVEVEWIEPEMIDAVDPLTVDEI